jgi:hypothetical protein
MQVSRVESFLPDKERLKLFGSLFLTALHAPRSTLRFQKITSHLQVKSDLQIHPTLFVRLDRILQNESNLRPRVHQNPGLPSQLSRFQVPPLFARATPTLSVMISLYC